MLSLCFAVPNKDTNLTAVDLSSSIYAPLAGCDLDRSQTPMLYWRRFQSTHPLRGATADVRLNVILAFISIHAPLAGCDMLRTNHLLAARCSILCRTCIFCVCRKHCRRRAVFATPCKDRHCMPYILSGSPLLCRCSTFGGSFPSHTNRLVCILWRFGSVFLMDVHRGPLWRSFAILPSRIVGFCGFALLFRSGFFLHISLLRFLFDPTMSFDSCFPAFRRM